MRFAFLVYVSRSGSTLVGRSLASHSRELVVLPEFRLVEVLIAEGEASVRRMDARRLLAVLEMDRQIGALGLDRGQLAELATACVGRGIRAILEALVARYIAARVPDRAAATTALIKLGTVVYVAEQIAALFPEARYLHVFRDPRAVTSSLVRNVRPYFTQQKMGRGDPIYIAQEYARVVRAVRALAERAPVHHVQYERFCTETAAVLREAAGFLGVAYQDDALPASFEVAEAEQGIHKLVDRAPEVARVSAWQSELAPWAGLAVERRLGPLLAELGYPPYFAPGLGGGAARVRAIAQAELHHARATAEHYVRRLAFYRTRPGWLGNRVKLALQRRGRV